MVVRPARESTRREMDSGVKAYEELGDFHMRDVGDILRHRFQCKEQSVAFCNFHQ